MATPETALHERYPIGSPDRHPSVEQRTAHIEAIRLLPGEFALAFKGLSDEQIDTPYREGGWTLRQLAHHVADSHLNAWARLKLALTEDWPTIKPYDEKLWAETAETRGPVDEPLALLAPLHARWAVLLAALEPAQWERGYVHPESGRTSVDQLAALYSWHGRHHTAHALGLRQRRGW